MSSKFGVRPAARKRPWICKRSPPCYKPPSFPHSLYCNFKFKYRGRLPNVPDLAGIILLAGNTEGGPLGGTWRKGRKSVSIVFWYEQDPDFGRIHVGINDPPETDEGETGWLAIDPPPQIEYETYEVEFEFSKWWSHVKITS